MKGLPRTVTIDGHEQFLRRLTDLADAGHVPVCVVIPHAGWDADDDAEQQLAARLCRRCPALVLCHAYGQAHPREVGVYGGRTEAERAGDQRRAIV